jgi:hypothetical protein
MESCSCSWSDPEDVGLSIGALRGLLGAPYVNPAFGGARLGSGFIGENARL